MWIYFKLIKFKYILVGVTVIDDIIISVYEDKLGKHYCMFEKIIKCCEIDKLY